MLNAVKHLYPPRKAPRRELRFFAEFILIGSIKIPSLHFQKEVVTLRERFLSTNKA
jgi:hypothetical protein